jgi:hypothetical protein
MRSVKTFEGVNMTFETKSKIEIAAVIIGIIVLFSMPVLVMVAGG